MYQFFGLLIGLVAVVGGVAITIVSILVKGAGNKSRLRNDPKLEDKVHVLEMRLQDMERQLNVTSSRLLELENKQQDIKELRD